MGREDNIRTDLREIGYEGVLVASGSGYGPVAGPCEYDNKPSGYIKEYVSDYRLLKNNFVVSFKTFTFIPQHYTESQLRRPRLETVTLLHEVGNV
jgi:hypothetical protein